MQAVRSEKRALLSERAYTFLREMILDTRISPKQLLSESVLANMVGMSRTPVREALKKLQNEKILISSDKKGYFLNVPTIKEIRDVYEVRTILEGGAVKLAGPRMDPQKLEDFQERFLTYKNGLGPNDKKDYDFVKLGAEFHFFIIDSTGNEKLKELLSEIYDHLEISRLYSYDRRGKVAIDEHIEIAGALRRGDFEKAQALMENHVRKAFEEVVGLVL